MANNTFWLKNNKLVKNGQNKFYLCDHNPCCLITTLSAQIIINPERQAVIQTYPKQPFEDQIWKDFYGEVPAENSIIIFKNSSCDDYGYVTDSTRQLLEQAKKQPEKYKLRKITLNQRGAKNGISFFKIYEAAWYTAQYIDDFYLSTWGVHSPDYNYIQYGGSFQFYDIQQEPEIINININYIRSIVYPLCHINTQYKTCQEFQQNIGWPGFYIFQDESPDIILAICKYNQQSETMQFQYKHQNLIPDYILQNITWLNNNKQEIQRLQQRYQWGGTWVQQFQSFGAPYYYSIKILTNNDPAFQ